LDQDVGCPDCGYNLRGLDGSVVICPECGRVSDIAQLVTRKWDKPWYKAPGFARLSMPAAWTWISFFLFFCVASSIAVSPRATSGTTNWLFLPMSFLICFGVWLTLLVWPCRTVGGNRGMLYALLVHASMACYLAGLGLIAAGMLIAAPYLQAVVNHEGDASPLALVLALGSLALGVVSFIGGRRLEKLVAGYCIRVYLSRPSTS